MTLYDLVANRQYQNKHVLSKLIEHHAHVPYKEVILHYDDEVSVNTVSTIDSDYWKYEKEKIPLEYIVGHVDFLGNSFAIDARAMIPRPETEYMIEAVLEGIKANRSEQKRTEANIGYNILDLGCGCGVLGLSICLLAEYKPQSLESRDLSPDAIDLTSQNINNFQNNQNKLNGIHIGTQVSRGLTELKNKPELLEQRQTHPLIIVCNYPYIPDDTFEDNADECAKTREPRMAFVGGSDGLDLYRVLLGEIIDYNLNHAVLYLEMMTWQMEGLQEEAKRRTKANKGEYTASTTDTNGHREFQIIKTFHFNIIIVKAEWKE